MLHVTHHLGADQGRAGETGGDGGGRLLVERRAGDGEEYTAGE